MVFEKVSFRVSPQYYSSNIIILTTTHAIYHLKSRNSLHIMRRKHGPNFSLVVFVLVTRAA